MEIVIYGLFVVGLMAISILLVKHVLLFCSRLFAAAWQAAILAMILIPLMAVTGLIDVSIEGTGICRHAESLCPEPGPTLEEALIHMIEQHEANGMMNSSERQEENTLTTNTGINPVLVEAHGEPVPIHDLRSSIDPTLANASISPLGDAQPQVEPVEFESLPN